MVAGQGEAAVGGFPRLRAAAAATVAEILADFLGGKPVAGVPHS